jgi:hypothetical protein
MVSPNTYRPGLGSTQPSFQRNPGFPPGAEAGAWRWPLTSIYNRSSEWTAEH